MPLILVTTAFTTSMQPTECIPVLRPKLPNADALLKYLRRIDETRIYSNFGPLALEFQGRIASILSVPADAVMCASSGTSALIGAILSVAGKPTRQQRIAICPAFTFPATAVAAERCGYEPHLVEIDPQTWMINPEVLGNHPRLAEVGLVLPSAPFGRPVPQEPWLEFHERTGIPIVIDGAASFACIGENPALWLGRIPVALSFHATKSFGIGEGGAVIWVDARAEKSVTRAINFGFYGERNSIVPSMNGKMSEYHAAVGLAEIDGWAEKFSSLCSRAAIYRESFCRLGLGDRFVSFPSVDTSYPLFLCADSSECRRIQDVLIGSGIGFRLWYGSGVHGHSHFAQCSKDSLSVTDSLLCRLLGLPMAPDLTDRAVESICRTVAKGLHGIVYN